MAEQKSKSSFDDVDKNSGEFKRTASSFRNIIGKDSDFPPAADRYVLYISLACPWASRCNAMIHLKGLQEVIKVVVVEPVWGQLNKREVDQHPDENEPRLAPPAGWIFAYPDQELFPGSTRDYVNGCKTLRQLYELDNPNYTGKYTVPVLWDTVTKRIVNNESSEIVPMFNSAFNEFAKHPEVNLIPDDLKSEIQSWNDRMYNTVNNGVYRAGFATKQEAYTTAVTQLFQELDHMEEHLSKNRYLCGSTFTEADLRLFVTLVRFDAVYVVHFKCNIRRIEDYPNLSEYVRDVYQIPQVKATVDIPQIKAHYFGSHPSVNPHGIVPVGPILDFDRPTSRSSLSQ